MINLKQQKKKNRFPVKSNFKMDVIPFEINNGKKHNIIIIFCLKLNFILLDNVRIDGYRKFHFLILVAY